MVRGWARPHGSLTAVTSHERHRAPALWLVAAAVGLSVAAAALAGAEAGTLVLVVALLGSAIARVVGGGRRPEGVAVRSPWVDVAVLVALAVGIGALSLSRGV